ncbi:MAG TPA: DNA-formamidopyrimidine glycosylase family protein [Sandaracinaceae bacterium LLY-WYZ-13_1]|nr:DNA-formamidopyrimidine glycosylase family protein [Sandaracinaceae bacterium LLY-WYZ-13_1]
MPELPEVEHARRRIAERLVGRRLAEVRCAEDPIVFEGRRAREVESILRGREVRAANRHGKVLWLALDRPPHPLFRLGMTGAWRFVDDEPLVLASSPKDPDHGWPPRFAKLHLTADDGTELVMTNARRLGRVLLRDDPPSEPPLSRLGFDPLTDMPSRSGFRARIARRRGVLKGLLLNQGFAAGVGNWIADEVLYQAGIDPRRRVESLAPEEVDRLHATLKRVIRVAVKADARKAAFPESWLFHHRWGKDPDARTARGERVEHLTVAGRTTAWVPERQR